MLFIVVVFCFLFGDDDDADGDDCITASADAFYVIRLALTIEQISNAYKHTQTMRKTLMAKYNTIYIFRFFVRTFVFEHLVYMCSELHFIPSFLSVFGASKLHECDSQM